MALNSNLSTSSLWSIENGKSLPTLETANNIAKALNIPLPELVDVNKIEL